MWAARCRLDAVVNGKVSADSAVKNLSCLLDTKPELYFVLDQLDLAGIKNCTTTNQFDSRDGIKTLRVEPAIVQTGYSHRNFVP